MGSRDIEIRDREATEYLSQVDKSRRLSHPSHDAFNAGWDAAHRLYSERIENLMEAAENLVEALERSSPYIRDFAIKDFRHRFPRGDR